MLHAFVAIFMIMVLESLQFLALTKLWVDIFFSIYDFLFLFHFHNIWLFEVNWISQLFISEY